jgi:hypothetical protein
MHGSALMPFSLSYPSNLKAAWTASGRGGNCKKTTFFCHLCAATKDDLVKYTIGGERCMRCQENKQLEHKGLLLLKVVFT